MYMAPGTFWWPKGYALVQYDEEKCDGRQPTCAACDERPDECVYESKESRQIKVDSSGQVLVEAIQILNAVPPQEAAKLLVTLRNIKDAPTILACLRDAFTKLVIQPSTIAAISGTAQRRDIDIELETRHPLVYPILIPIDISSPESPFRRLVESSGNLPRPFIPSGNPIQQRLVQHNGVMPQLSPPQTPPHEQLSGLKINRWTNVAVTDDFASRIISLYLTTDHPLLSSFDSKLFTHTLVTMEGEYCTSLLVNSLMYWACQMYSSLDTEALNLVDAFCEEAETLWKSERPAPSALTMVAAQFLSFGYLVQGKDHAVLQYLSEALKIGTQLELFGVKPNVGDARLDNLTPEMAKATAYSAWGVFNWITLMGLFYHQPGIEYLKSPPTLAIPDDGDDERAAEQDLGDMQSVLPQFMGQTFRALCQFWRIMHEVAVMYYGAGSAAIPERVPLHFAENKFRELLAWADGLPMNLVRSERNPHHVVILHLWLHAAILDIFRPFLQNPGAKMLRVATFSSSGSTPDAIFAASVQQLKRLIIIYRFNYTSSAYTILWHTALLYVANALLRTKGENDWLFYFLLCLYGYEGLRPSYRVAEAVAGGLLSMAMRSGDISSDEARRVMAHLQEKGQELDSSEIRATFMVDLDLAMSDPVAATAETLAYSFHDIAMMMDYTTIYENK
ncbi:C6 transcription factor [Trichoderma guizhouense]|uniref:C6 transcription factor n=1 Tax=Trichoderma guizhouense TaxID=1491466 RepID=A0A1T3CYQ8_9HYPO|nr:C6 transcription factor [Trichoderma guizhouense]